MREYRDTATRMSVGSGGAGAFRWSPAGGGLFAFQARGLGSAHAPHVHAWYCFYVVTNGSVAVRRGCVEWLATPGMVVLLSPFEVHEEMYTGAAGCSYSGIYPTDSKVRALLGTTARGAEPLVRFRRPVVDDPVVAAHILAIHDESLGTACPSLQTQRLVTLLDVLRARHDGEPDRRPLRGREHRAVGLVREYLQASHRTVPAVASMACVAGLSRFHLTRVFRDAVGLSPYTYFEQVRLARARLLIHAGASLARATFAAGFSDQSHMSRQFRQQVATTPGQYARAVRGALQRGTG